MKTATPMTLESLKAKWIGRKVYGSTSDERTPVSMLSNYSVIDIHLNKEDMKYYAWTGEHVKANTLEALDRRLESLKR